MIGEDVILSVEDFIPKDKIHLNEPMSLHTTFRTGGNADCFVEPENDGQLKELLGHLRKKGVPFYVLGNGSNTLVRDEGYHGVVVHIGSGFAAMEVEGECIRAQAGALLSRVAKFAYENGLAGMEFASGIPGTIGGAVVMNAGAYGREMKDIVTEVVVLGANGERMALDKEAMNFGYRQSFVKGREFVVSEVSLKLAHGEKEEIKGVMDELSKRRRAKQPLEYPSAGSTFKRPKGNFAGKLIMEAGMSGYRAGGAKVSEKHCGFVVNAGNATSSDVLTVMEEVRKRVKEKFGVNLEPEIIIL